ncbi:myomesin-2 isoform X1 [Chiloscyllium plagiosum]|uniref:myomesin-2 isoform X1 n=1 Tax=Chiloscyllium plagiosum TaxID=36176 RepID=UPI001CB7CEC6|nr:myomesin-2 isoform X1 [Chiloscyllium plagiosum]XP_043535119.1 myomesin-2 isoform X1 [Chiloscyllium plagiosum]
MATKVLPFYQKRHKHYGYDYRNLDTRSVVKKYTSKSSVSKRSRLSLETSLSRHSPCAKRVCQYAEEEVPEYTVPPFRSREGEEEEVKPKPRVFLYGTKLREMEAEISKLKRSAHEQADMLALKRMEEERLAVQRHIREDSICRAPEFLVRLRSHTVWENSFVKLFCTVQGFPTPLVRWYRDDVYIDQTSEPTKYRMDSYYGVHSLEINRCATSDTAQYTALAFNIHGEASSSATVIVKRFRGDEEPYHSVLLPLNLPLLSPPIFTHIDIQYSEKFGVSFGTEGETMILSCRMILTPNLHRLQPEVVWYRDDVEIKKSKWAVMQYSDCTATLTLPHLNKDDEGLYTTRLITRGGISQHSAYLFVRDADAPIVGAPGAPMDVTFYDANKDYVILTWKPPNVTKESPVIGYFVDRCEAGSDNWIQCNDAPIKICKYPVTGLFEGRSYIFRVRAVNKSGISRPSRITDAVTALDPADLARLQTIYFDASRQIVISQDELEGDIKPPGIPTNVHVAETSRNYIVLSWDPPEPRGREPLMYYIEKTMAGSASWQRINQEIAARSPRFAIFDLAEGKSYEFRVFAVNKFGMSQPSASTGPVTVQEHIEIPASPSGVRCARNTKHSIVVHWTPSKSAKDLIGYYIDSCLVGTNDWQPCNHKPVKYTRFVVHGLKNGHKYIFRVKAVNALGTSEMSQESDPITVQAALRGGIPHAAPSSPYGITLLDCTNDSMTLGWKAPRFTGGSDIIGYYMDHREITDLHWHESNIKPITGRVHKVENLKGGSFYEFKISAMNVGGVGVPSDSSRAFKCEAWTMSEPGPPYDLTFCEIRKHSLVILWKAPIYTGNSAVTGYTVDICETDSDEWRAITEKAVSTRYLKVTNLEEGRSYIFRVHAVNTAGQGRPSEPSEPILIQVRPGTKEITSGVDAEGNIYLSFECHDMTDASQFTWGKAYEEITDFSKVHVETDGEKSKLIFKHPDMADLGTYSVAVSDTDGISSSYNLEKEELERLMALSHEIRHPTIPLKSELSYEVFDKGQVRFWLQTESVSPNATCKFIVNDLELADSKDHKITFNKSTGMVEMVMEQFTSKNEGTYTVQIQDGKAKNQSTLVLIGDVFKAALEEAEFQRKEFLRKQGPHFAEYLSWHVTEDCIVELICKVANTKKETVFGWYKDYVAVPAEEPPNPQTGESKLSIPEFSRKDMGEYKMTLKDDKGQDVTVLEVAGKVYEEIVQEISRISGFSASELKIKCTPEGIRLQSFLKYYMEDMKVFWYHKDSKIASSEKMRIGGSSDQVWMQICEPNDRDKGKYTMEIFDGKTSYKRHLDLSGEAYAEAYTEFQRLKAAAFAEKNRGKVIGGLPDVVTIMEGKTLSLTSTVFGDPTPEVTWLKNDKDLELNDHHYATLEQGKYASLTIKAVSTEDSGKYGINVRNKYGGETIDITVSVYKHGEEIPVVKRGVQPPEQAKASHAEPSKPEASKSSKFGRRK